jgi:hypothetical protein
MGPTAGPTWRRERKGRKGGVVTPDFKDKTKCITICISGSSSIHIETLSVNNQQ